MFNVAVLNAIIYFVMLIVLLYGAWAIKEYHDEAASMKLKNQQYPAEKFKWMLFFHYCFMTIIILVLVVLEYALLTFIKF